METRIPLTHRGKRPQFFAGNGMDELLSMVLELASETWVIRRRLYLLERVAARNGLELTRGIEGYEPDPDEARELEEMRRRLVATVLRAVETDPAGREQVKQDMTVIGGGLPGSEPAAMDQVA